MAARGNADKSVVGRCVQRTDESGGRCAEKQMEGMGGYGKERADVSERSLHLEARRRKKAEKNKKLGGKARSIIWEGKMGMERNGLGRHKTSEIKRRKQNDRRNRDSSQKERKRAVGNADVHRQGCGESHKHTADGVDRRSRQRSGAFYRRGEAPDKNGSAETTYKGGTK